ncbi:MAG: beta-ketoacyl-ACP synthase III [Actinomycetota bacterium]
MGTAITGWGKAVPEKVVTNDEMASHLNIDGDWIFQRTGVSARRIATTETTTTLAAAAGRSALEMARMPATRLDAVIVATVTPDMGVPATASLVQHELGAKRAAAFDINAGCSGFVYALAQASALVESRFAAKVLVIGADVLSRITNMEDPKTAPLFGDGAGAVIVENIEGGRRVGPFVLGSDGSRPELLYLEPEKGHLVMQGREVYRHAVERMSEAIASACDAARCTLSDIDLFVMHQANARILDAVGVRAGLDPDKVFSNIGNLGNTSAASIPLALTEAASCGRLSDGDRVMLGAFGAGFTWAAGIVTWGSWASEMQRRGREVSVHA